MTCSQYERARVDNVVPGREPSGAWIWPDEMLTPDGPLATIKLVALIAELPSYLIRRESIEVEAKNEVMERVAACAQEKYESVETLDGVRVEREDIRAALAEDLGGNPDDYRADHPVTDDGE